MATDDGRTTEYGDVEPQAAFWRRHVRIGVSLYAVGAIGVAVPRSRRRAAGTVRLCSS